MSHAQPLAFDCRKGQLPFGKAMFPKHVQADWSTPTSQNIQKPQAPLPHLPSGQTLHTVLGALGEESSNLVLDADKTAMTQDTRGRCEHAQAAPRGLFLLGLARSLPRSLHLCLQRASSSSNAHLMRSWAKESAVTGVPSSGKTYSSVSAFVARAFRFSDFRIFPPIPGPI